MKEGHPSDYQSGYSIELRVEKRALSEPINVKEPILQHKKGVGKYFMMICV